jgi:glyoxylase-like metal-dependent hydrolase (beta-lactamase superfamily II)
VRKPTRTREVGRGERVLPGLWRLRLPLPWPGVPHCNAWALAAGDGVVLVDSGMHEPGSMAHLERALDRAGLRVEDVRLVVCTHAHVDHCGQAPVVAERAGCEVWLHPAFADRPPPDDPTRYVEIARQSGVPDEPLRRWLERRRSGGSGQGGVLRSDRDLVDGVTVGSDLGDWHVVETPGHTPSHVCLHQPERRLLISGDHVLGRVSLFFDHGLSPDPVGEFLASLDRVEPLGARLGLSGHGRPFTDVPGHIEGNRALVARRLAAVDGVLEAGPKTAYEVARATYGDGFTEETASWLMNKTLCWLTHLERTGAAARQGDAPERWSRPA